MYKRQAVECKKTRNFLGYVGFHNIAFESDFTPGVEIGWRLCRDVWGKGYATEAASACLDYAVSYTHLDVYKRQPLPHNVT